MEGRNISLTQWCKRVTDLQYAYGTHIAPHDIKRRDYGSGASYLSLAAEHGIDFEVCPQLGLKEGIDAVKAWLPRLQFNFPSAQKGYDCLVNYRREYNDKLRVFMDKPLHDWASHGADAMRMAAIGFMDGFGYANNYQNINVIRSNGRSRPIMGGNKALDDLMLIQGLKGR